MSKTTRGFYPKNNNFFSLEYNNTNNDEKKIPLRSKKLKPSINQFEYIERINNEKKKLNYNSDNSPRHTNINHSKNIFVKGKTKSANMELNDSFRQKFSKNMNNHNNNFCQNMKFKNKSCNNDIIQKSIEDFQDEFPFSHKKNYRSSEEIRKFVKDKKLKNKKKEDEILLEKNKKLFLLFKNLYNLNMKDFSKATPSVTTEHFYIRSPNIPTISSRGKGVMPSRSSNNYTNSSKNETNNSHNKLRKKKEINEYYIGNDSTLKNNNSTLVDPNEYYLNVLESQQLFVNSALNKIENDSVNSENDNELNVSKEQIQKIISKESKINNSSGKKNNNLILNTNEYNDFKKKIDNTLKRAGNLFSNKDQEKTEENKNNKEIIIKEKKKEKDLPSNKKDNNKSPEIHIESSNAENQKKIINNIDNTGKDTKEKNLPSLSHTFSTNSNPNKKIEIEIEPKAVVNLVEILKFIIQRKVFVLLYESYINRAMFQQYTIAFAYFVAVCKQYAFRKLEEYSNYKTYKYAFRHLFKPFIRRAFKKLFKISFTKGKINYLMIILNKYFKSKILLKLYDYSLVRNKRIQNNKKNIQNLVNSLKKVYLKLNYDYFKNQINLETEELKKNYNNNIKKIDDLFKEVENKNIINDNNKDDDDKINLNDYKNKEDSINLSDYSENNYRRKNDNSIKMNSYMYESSESRSLSLEPNSEGNDRLHQLKLMLLIKNNLVNEDSRDMRLESNSNSLNNSYQNVSPRRMIGHQINEKISISDDDEIKDDKDELQRKIKKNKKINDKDNKNNSIEADISADKDKSNEIEWGYNVNTANSIEDKNKKIKKSEPNDLIDDDDDDYNDFEKDEIFDNYLKKKEKDVENDTKKEDINKVKEDRKKDEEKDINILKNENKQDKSRNIKQDDNTENKINNINEDIKNKENPLKDNKDVNDKINENKKNDIIIIQKEEQKKKDKEKEEEKKKEKEKEREKEREREREKEREKFSKKVKEIKDPEKLANDLTEEILKNILLTEIKSSKKKLVPLKKFKFDKFDKMNSQSNSLNNSYGSAGNTHDHLSKEFGLGGLSQLSLADDLLSLNDSIMSNYSAHSVFNKTIKDKKKDQSLHLYFHVIAPKLIRLIRKEIIDKYDLIYDNISTPMKNNSEKLMMSLALQDAELLRDNYKTTKNLVSIAKILDKEKILKNFEPINKKIRNNDNLTSDDFYDKMLNDCIVETAIEIINKERIYGKNGEPLKWSYRTHELAFKYRKDDPKKLANFVCKKIYLAIRRKVGLIADNYDNMSPDQINYERDRRLTSIIKRDLDEYEYQWNNLEMEETQLKVDNSELIMEQLYNEVIEILEHIQFSRIRPDLYQNKSIYACEEIPKLDFQLTTTEDATMAEGNDNNDNVNV